MDARHSRSLEPAAMNNELAEKQDRDFVIALARGLVILRKFRGRARELGSADIAARMGLPQPTVWRLCNTLLDGGLLARAPGTDKLSVGPAALRLARSYLTSKTVLAALRPRIRDLLSRFEGAINVGARDDRDMTILDRVYRTMFMTPQRIGARVPIGGSALGWAYLCGLDEPERLHARASLPPLQVKAAAPLGAAFDVALARYREDGFVMTRGLLFPEINAVSVAFPCPDHGEMLAMACVGNSATFDDVLMGELGRQMCALLEDLQLCKMRDLPRDVESCE